MAVAWTTGEASRVQRVLEACPPDSGKCGDVAKRVLGIARKRYPEAHAVRIRPVPGTGYFVVPRIPLTRSWDYHVTTIVTEHAVDVITGAYGTEWEVYLSTHFEFDNLLEVVGEAL